MKIALVGAGGFATDVKALMGQPDLLCFVDDEYFRPNDDCVLPLSKFDPKEYQLLITVSNPSARAKIVSRLPANTQYFTYIDSSALLMVKRGISLGKDCIVSAGCKLVDNIIIGDHCQLNLDTIVGHDVRIGNYFTSATRVIINGNSMIGNGVYFGTNACSKEKITVVDNVTVGLNSGVVSNLMEPGTYVGTPARKIK